MSAAERGAYLPEGARPSGATCTARHAPPPALARSVAASPRNLTRLFHAWVGTSPKLFCRTVRFQSVLRHLGGGNKPDWAALAAELGYADQSHLIRDFSDFAQVSPGALGETPT